MSDVDVTEITELRAEKVSGVGSPANGTPFLLLKAAEASTEDEAKGDKDEEKGDWWDKNKAKVTTKKSDSAESDEFEEEVLKEDEPDTTKKSTGVPDESVSEPKEAGHLATGKSGLAGEVVTGTQPSRTGPPNPLGGATTSGIPDAQSVAKAIAVASLAGAIDQIAEQRAAIKDGKYLTSPGSVTGDSANLTQVSETLAGCSAALDNILQREAVEAASGNGSDIKDVWDLEDARKALECALGIAARLSFHEAAEGKAEKAYRRLNVGDTGALTAARDHLSAVIDGAAGANDAGRTTGEEVIKVADVTKEELVEAIAAGTAAGVQKALKEEKKARKEAKKEAAAKAEADEAAEKNANNKGDISEGDIKATSQTDAENVSAVGGAVDAEYVNKGTEDESEGALSKQVADQLDTLTKGLRSVEETVAKIAKRPRAGGPSLDGQARGVAPAAEGRQGDVTKSSGDVDIEALEKALETEKDPSKRDQLGLKITHAKLVKMHETGQL